MADAAEAVAGLPAGTVRLKWPNDLVVEAGDGTVRKLAGVLGETDGLGTDDPRVVVGLGINADWPAATFPPDLADGMTSLREAPAAGRSTATPWPTRSSSASRRASTRSAPGASTRPAGPTASRRPAASSSSSSPMARASRCRPLGVDPVSGALLVEDPSATDGRAPSWSARSATPALAPTVGV